MSAWGPKPFDNDIAKDFLAIIAIEKVQNVLVEEFTELDRLTPGIKHRLANRYDRFRAAVELMLTFETNGWYAFASGYYDLAWEKMQVLLNDTHWRSLWDTKDHAKSYNYMEDCRRQSFALDKFYEAKTKAEPK